MMAAFEGSATIILTSAVDSELFQEKRLLLKPGKSIKIGRKVSSKTAPEPGNGYFDAKVLSRTHAELSIDKNIVSIQDLQSSNGTFINGDRLSEEGKASTPWQLQSGDILDFGVDIKDDDGKVLYNKIACKITIEMEVPQQQSYQNVKIQYSEEFLQMLQDEKNLSLDATIALDKIKVSFEALENRAASGKDDTIVRKKAVSTSGEISRPVDNETRSIVNEMTVRLSSLEDAFSNQKNEFQSLKPSGTIVDLPTAPSNDALDLYTASIEALRDEINETKGESHKETKKAVRALETALLTKIDVLMSTIAYLKQDSELSRSESARSETLMTGLRADLADINMKREEEKERINLLETQLEELLSRMGDGERLIELNAGGIKKLASNRPTRENLQVGKEFSSEGPPMLLVFMVVFLAGIASAVVFYKPQDESLQDWIRGWTTKLISNFKLK